VRFDQRSGSSFRSAISQNNFVNPFIVISKGAVNSLFNLNVPCGSVNGAFVDLTPPRNGGADQLGNIASIHTTSEDLS
jgi:hypothetical protein